MYVVKYSCFILHLELSIILTKAKPLNKVSLFFLGLVLFYVTLVMIRKGEYNMKEIKNERLLSKLTESEIKYIVSEQAQSVSKLLALCIDLGEPFIKHFHKVLKDIENQDWQNFMHHCREMQGWWNKVKSQRYKHSKKIISNEDLIDSFFTVGAISEDYLDEGEAYIYETEFIPQLLADREQKISDVLDKIFNLEGIYK